MFDFTGCGQMFLDYYLKRGTADQNIHGGSYVENLAVYTDKYQKKSVIGRKMKVFFTATYKCGLIQVVFMVLFGLHISKKIFSRGPLSLTQ